MEKVTKEFKANMELYMDAQDTIEKTGKLPSELAAEREELIKEIKKLRKELKFHEPVELYSNSHPYRTSGKLISSIEKTIK